MLKIAILLNLNIQILQSVLASIYQIQLLLFLLKIDQSGLFLFIFVLLSLQFQLYKLNKSVDGVHGIQTRCGVNVGADETSVDLGIVLLLVPEI